MEEYINQIISKFTNVLSQINPSEFMNKIMETKEENERIEISKKFCELITSVKAQLLFDIPDELSSLIKKDKLIDESNNSFIINKNEEKKSNINSENFNIKNILAQFKLKLFNLNSNISELNINLNNISGNLKKHKYSLASKRVENLYKLKDKMNINITFLEGIRNNIYENIDFFSKKNINDSFSKKKIIQLTKTPSPNRLKKNIQNFSTIRLNSRNANHKKNLSTNKLTNINIKPYKTIESKRKSTSNNLTINTTPSKSKRIKSIKYSNTLSKIETKKIGNNNIFDREKDEMIRKLKLEIETLNQKNNNIVINNNFELSKVNIEKTVLLFFNEKLGKISDSIFSITFLITNLQNKYTKISSEKELTDINNNIMKITSEISEIKTNLLKMSIENKNIFTLENKDKANANIEKDFDISLYKTRIKNMQTENQNLKSLIEELNIKISSLNEMISSSKSDNSEICSLKEKLNQSEKKITEMRNIYEADLSSKTLIENLLQKNLEEQKIYYEEKISKLNKKLEENIRENKIFYSLREEPLKTIKNDDIFSSKELNSSFANEINSIKNFMNNNNDLNKLKNEVNELNEKLSKKDKEIIYLITNNNKEKKSITETYENKINELNKEINILKLQNETNKDKFKGGEEIQIIKKDKTENYKTIIKKYIQVQEIIINLKPKLIDIEKGEKDNISDDEDDEDTDEEFIIKLKKLNEQKKNDNYEMKVYKKENRKLIHRYEDALDENHELKKKMILIEEIVINKQNELYNNLKKGFKDLLIFLNINSKSKGKIIYFLNLIQFTEQEIKLIIGKKK